jgi:microcystin-dependent protein
VAFFNDVADAAVPWPEGMLPGAVNNSARALMAGVARLIADLNGTLTTGGTAGSYTVTSNSAHTSLTNGILVTAKASATNTAGATLNLNTFGAKSIRVMSTGAEAAIAAGRMISGGTYQFRYDTAANSAAGGWMLLNPEPDTTLLIQTGDIKTWSTGTLPTGYLWCNGALVSRTTYAALFAAIGTNYGAGDGSTTFALPDLCGRMPLGLDNMGGISPKGRVTVASGFLLGLGIAAGLETITLDATQIPAHTHTGTTQNANTPHTHTGTTNAGGVDHTHAQATPTTTNGTFTGPGSTGWGGTYPNNSTATSGASAFSHTHTFTTNVDGDQHTHTFTTSSIGGGVAHNNMPPAIYLNFIIKT